MFAARDESGVMRGVDPVIERSGSSHLRDRLRGRGGAFAASGRQP